MLRIIVAIVLIMHGAGHTMGFLESWTPVSAGFSSNPSVLPGGLSIESGVGKAFGILWLLVTVGYVASGLGLIFQQDWWRPLAIASAFLSLLVILPWWNTVGDGARFGGTLVSIATVVALLFPWGDRVVEAMK